MLTVRRLPRTRAAITALVGSLESTVALAMAHLLAGGDVPSALSLTAFGALVYVAGLAVLTERTSIRVAAPALLATQVLGHAWLVALAPGHGMDHHGDGIVLGLSPAMLLAHTLAAAVAATTWALRRCAVDLVLHWSEQLTAQIARAPRVPVAGTRAVLPATHLLGVAPTRGPPAALATA